MSLTRNALAPFLLVSLAFHLVFLVRWSAPAPRERIPEEIPVTVLPAPQESTPRSSPAGTEASLRPAEPAAPPQKRTTTASEVPRTQPSAPVAAEEPPSRVEVAKARVIEAEPAPARPLPKLKDLVPNAVGLAIEEASGRREAPIPLNSKDPRYVPYLTIVQETLNAIWKYPPLALRHGLQGKATIEFVILSNGELGGARLVQSSGYAILDQEAIRALTVASPFPPIPARMGKSRMDIVDGFDYIDNRVKYNTP